MTASHAPHLSQASRASQQWRVDAPSPVDPMPARVAFTGPRLARALALGVATSAMVGAPISYLLLLTAVSLRGPAANPALAGRAALLALVVIAAPLTVMLAHTPRGLRRRWLPVHLAVELTVALAIGAWAGFSFG